MLYYAATTALLAAVLFFPASRLIFVLSVRRLERRRQRRLTDAERHGQRARAAFIAVFLVIIFAALFNYNLVGIPSHE